MLLSLQSPKDPLNIWSSLNCIKLKLFLLNNKGNEVSRKSQAKHAGSTDEYTIKRIEDKCKKVLKREREREAGTRSSGQKVDLKKDQWGSDDQVFANLWSLQK